MTVIYDNWDRLVAATLRREELREIALRTPSDLSSVSAATPSLSHNFSSNYGQDSSFLVGETFSYSQILRATDFLNDSNLIKHGQSGDLYFGVLEDGIEVVVKRVKVSSFDRELCFISEMEICGMVDHPRLIPLLGYCSENADEKFLVYKLMPNKDLSRFLAGRSDDDRPSAILDWKTRVKIATGVVEGLCYLHQYSPPLVHRDIQASSILLDDEFEVQLGSLTGICIEEKNSIQNKLARFLRSPKGFEQNYSGAINATCAYDVYCVGKVLVELITGKLGCPVNDSAMKDWLGSTLRHIVADDKELIVNIVDISLMIDNHHLFEAWAVASIAKACLNRNPSKRPSMAEILKALENLASFTDREFHPSGHYSSIASTLSIKQVPKSFKTIEKFTSTIKSKITGSRNVTGVKFDQMRVNRYLENYTAVKLQRYSYADIKKITKGFKMSLGEGGFGKVYKGEVSDGIIVAVKVLNKSVDTREAFVTEVAVMGVVHHINVVRLLGFCADGFTRALVFEFVPKGSLATFIYPIGQRENTLGMEMLQNIAIGIARGIKHLHQECQLRILHLDIKPENILLDENYNPKIADFGLAKQFGGKTNAVTITDIRGTVGYIAPEVFSRQFGKVSYKSDIYSFGMLLLEMVGQQRTIGATVQDKSDYYLPEWIYQSVIDGELTTRDEENGEEIMFKTLAIVGLWCIQCYPEDRPSITSVLQMLEGNGEALSLPPNPFTSSSQMRIDAHSKSGF